MYRGYIGVVSFVRSFVSSSFGRSGDRSFIHWFVRSLILPFVRSVVVAVVHSLVRPFVNSSVRSVGLAVVRSFVGSFFR